MHKGHKDFAKKKKNTKPVQGYFHTTNSCSYCFKLIKYTMFKIVFLLFLKNYYKV